MQIACLNAVVSFLFQMVEELDNKITINLLNQKVSVNLVPCDCCLFQEQSHGREITVNGMRAGVHILPEPIEEGAHKGGKVMCN